MRVSMPGLDMTFEAAADLSLHQYKFAKPTAPVVGGQQVRVNICAAGDRAIGVLQNKPNAAGLGAVIRTSGRSKLMVDGTVAIAVGATLKASATGVGVVGVDGTDKCGAIALEASVAAGDIIDVLLVEL